jgi:hypothetical protein
MGFYERLGVGRVINAGTTFTALGGTLMPPEVLDAMRDAAGSFVDMHELHLAAGRRLAELTHNDAAYVTSGCAAALVLGVLAARTCGDLRLIDRMPDAPGVPDEVVMHTAHEAAIIDRTAALYVAGRHLARGALPLDEVVRIAHERQVPVIVDAAAQLPPVENLWRFTLDAHADLAVFSGGKALHGPQASGLMVGRADLVSRCHGCAWTSTATGRRPHPRRWWHCCAPGTRRSRSCPTRWRASATASGSAPTSSAPAKPGSSPRRSAASCAPRTPAGSQRKTRPSSGISESADREGTADGQAGDPYRPGARSGGCPQPGDFAEYNAAYQEFFTPPYPARTTVGSDLMNILVEIDVVAKPRD